jgi:hypothetical protein
MRAAFLALALSLLPAVVSARTVEPGSLMASGGIGPGFKMGSALGASGTYFLVNGQGEYSFTKDLSAVAGLELGLSGTKPLKLRAGARYRLTNLDLPVSPYAEVQFSVGRLWNVIGADLTTVGARIGGGADYFLTAKLAVGGQLGFDFSSTLGQRRAYYGLVEVLALATYVFDLGTQSEAPAKAAEPTVAPAPTPATPAKP